MTLISKIYANTKETLRTADKLVMALIMLIIASMAIAVPAYATSGGSGSGSRSEVIKHNAGNEINITQFSGLITDSFCDMMTDVASDETKRLELLDKIDQVGIGGGLRQVSLSNIGNLMGVNSDVAQSKQTANVFPAGDDVASKKMNLETIAEWYGNDAEKIKGSGMTQYIMFGSMLSYIGIDEFRDASANSDGLRMIIGYVIYICFILAYSASGIMGYVVKFLNNTNVFGWIHNTLVGVSGNQVEGVGNTGNLILEQNHGFFQTVADIYLEMYEFRWVIFGLMVVLFVASITVFKSKQMGAQATNQTRARNLLLRVVIMCIGMPLVGMVYSTTLGLVTDGIDDTKYRMTDFIFSQFLDYEDWTLTDSFKTFQGLEGLSVEYSTDKQSMDVTMPGTSGNQETLNTSKLVYNINKAMYSDFITADYEDAGHTDALYEAGTTKMINYESMLNKSKVSGAIKKEEEAYLKARDLILGYARSNVVSSDVLNAQFISAYNDILDNVNIGNDEENEKNAAIAISRIFNNTASSYRLWSYHDKELYELDPYGKFKITVKNTPIFPWMGSGGINADDASYITITEGAGVGPAPKVLMMKVLYNAKDSMHPNVIGGGNYGGYAYNTDVLRVSSADFDRQGDVKTYNYTYEGSGMSALALYNYMHSKFDMGTVHIYTPDLTSNGGVSMLHYSVSTPYSGIPEMIQLVYTICILFSVGIIGWLFGISMLVSALVQMFKAVPLIFKMAVGSIQGFVEALLTVLSIVAELLITILLYTFSVQIISAMISITDTVLKQLLTAFVSIDGETMSIVSNLLSVFIILWGTFEIIKWRQAITISIKSMLTHVLNTVFGTSASMPTGASSGMLKAAAIGGAAAMTAGALAEQGALDDVVNDMTQSDLGSSVGDKLKEGDAAGAWNDIKDYANGEYAGDIRGGSAMDKEAQSRGLLPAYNSDGSRMRDEETGEAMYTDGNGNTYTASEMQDMPDAYQDLTEDQAASMKGVDDQIAAENALADKAEAAGDAEGAAEHRAKAEQLSKQRAGMDAEYRAANYAKAKEAGVANYADYERTLSDSGSSGGGTHMPEAIEGDASIPEEPSKELGRYEQEVYDAAREGNAKTLQNMGGTYNNHGLTADQVSQVDEAIANGASETDVAAMVDGFAQENFGDDYKNVVSKLNEANGRSGNATYGTNDNSEGNARTVHVATSRDASGQLSYGVTDNNSQAGAQQIVVSDDGQGGVSYTNMTAGGGNANTIETVDMGSASNADAEQYATTFNSTAAMIRLSGGSVSNANVGMGGAQQVTITEMAAMSSRQQMAANNISVNAQAYGNSDAADVGMAMTNVQTQATIRGAASGQQVQAPAYTPLTISSEAGKAAGVATYQTKISDVSGSQAPAVTLERTGGVENTGPQTIKVDYSGSANGGNSGGANYVSVGGSKAQETVAVNMTGEDGQLKMPSRDDILKAAAIKAAVDAISNDGEGDGDNGGSGRHR